VGFRPGGSSSSVPHTHLGGAILKCAKRFGLRPRSCRFGLREQRLPPFLGVDGKFKVWGRAESGSFAAAVQSASRRTLRYTNITRQLSNPGREAFDAVADEYDDQFTNSQIGRAQRQSVWQETDRLFRPGQRILEINCGTGVDALHLAARGIHVVASDASAKMVEVAQRRRDASASQDRLEFRVLPIERIGQLEREGPYDGVLSNFAGLNCVADLQSTARDLSRLIRPGGLAILCMFGRFCLWEMLWYAFQGDIRKAFRRLRGGRVVANLAHNRSIYVRYPSVGSLCRDFAPHFRLARWKGVGIAVPPSYLEPAAVRFARMFALAAKIDPYFGRCPGLRALADHVVLVFERVNA